MDVQKPKGRPPKYSEYDALYKSLPKVMEKRPKYIRNIGVFRGKQGDTAWVKVCMTHGGVLKGKSYAPGDYAELKVGKLSSWDWKALEARRDELQGKADRNEPLEERVAPLFKDYAENWLKDAKGRLKGAKTPEYHINKHLIPAFGHKTLDTISTHDINTWQGDRLEVAKPSTVKRELATLKSIIGNACKGSHPLLKVNPCKELNQIKGISGRQRPLSEKEITTLLAEAKKVGDWLPHTILFLLHSGIRRGELLKLRWEDVVALPDGRVIVLIKQTKSDKNRTITCSKTMKVALNAFRKLGGKEAVTVFPHSKMTLRRGWEEARKEAGLDKLIVMHDLRASHITYGVGSGVDIRTMAGRSGHSNLRMFEEHYAALSGARDAEAANTIENTFGKILKGETKKRRKAK